LGKMPTLLIYSSISLNFCAKILTYINKLYD
jgi:hypothetical protein